MTIATKELAGNAGVPSADARQTIIQLNNAIADLQTVLVGATQGNSIINPTVLSMGSTNTQLATTAFQFSIAGVPATKAAVAAGTALGALGTIPASTWGLIAVDVVAAGTLSYVSAAANYTTGYASEAAAIAANPAVTAAKARVGYITVLASASTWVAGTDALATGTGGNPATTTHYYPAPSAWSGFAAQQLANSVGTVITA